MRMSIQKMKIENFKGIRLLNLDFAQQTHISGMNGTGKSSIVDAFCWVLYNKDSAGNAPGSDAFHEKPLDEDGKEIHNLDTVVELVCTLDGSPFNLKRQQRENWVKKRGSAQPTYSGNVSTYWINDVEVKLTEFKERIYMIASEEVFRLIGSLSAFNTLEWKKRRQQLIALSGTDIDGELLSRTEYRPLADESSQRGVSIDDLRKILTDQRKRTNEELRSFPIRIDEAKRALPVFGPHELEDAEYIVKDTQKDIERVDTSIAEALSGSGEAAIIPQIRALEAELVSLRSRISSAHADGRRMLEAKISNLNAEHISASKTLDRLKASIKEYEAQLERETSARDKLRVMYSKEYERKFEYTAETVCPTCGQTIPEDQQQEALERAKARFTRERAASLDEIRAKGKEAAANVGKIEAIISNIGEDAGAAQDKIDYIAAARKATVQDLENYPISPDYSTEPRIGEIEAQLDSLRHKALEAPETKVEGLRRRKVELQEIVDRNKAIIARRDAGIETEQRIKALEAAQLETADRLSDIEKKIILLEKFITDRCSALEASINEKFPTVRWKLFDIQINGGIIDTCVCMIPCSSGLVSYESANTAAQINADVEIVNVLSAHYDVQIPLFVDNSERVNRLAHTDTQLITLAVSGGDLRIEHKEVM